MRMSFLAALMLISLAVLCPHASLTADEENPPAIVGNADVLTSHDAHFHDADCGHKRRYHDGRWNYFYNGFWEYYDGNRGIWYYYARAQAHAAEDGGKSYTDPTTGMEFVFVKGGCYQMGDIFGDGRDNEKPIHEICVDNFYIGKYEVTQRQWKGVMENGPSVIYFKDCGDNGPVESVSWNNVQEYINRLNNKTGKNYRLPTEAEWEYAARSGGKKEKWAGTSNESELDNYTWYDKNSQSKTHPVGQKKPNGLGLYDMSGNVWEWVQDWYGSNYYKNSPKNNPIGPNGGNDRVLRGGSFNPPRGLRTTTRAWGAPDYRPTAGFRLLLPAQ